MARMSLTVEENLTPDQAGFRPGRSTCGQLLNLTQYIEDGFEEKQIFGTVFVDLTEAYDTVNHKILLLKVAKMIKNKKIVSIIQTLLKNRRFFVEMDGRKSRWRLQKNGLIYADDLCLATQSTSFNAIETRLTGALSSVSNYYTENSLNANPSKKKNGLIYADDLCLATQPTYFNAIETRLTDALSSLSNYYTENSLNANPSKTQVCAFHLNNHQANTKLEITWNDQPVKYDEHPVYLGVTLDRTLSFSQHAMNVKSKVAARNSLLRKLANSNWGADPKTLRTTALTVSYSTAEYSSAVWARSCHAKKVDAKLNNACRIVTGQLRPTPLPLLYRTAGIAPPDIRRQTHGNQAASHRLELWNTWDNTTNEAIQPPKEQLPSGRELQRKDWVTLNRARAKVGKTASTLHKWKLRPNSECPCGHQNQTMDHILSECTEGPHCTDQDLRDCTDAAQALRAKI
ncbi:LOW QUALITY PROTEIN: retrovirus-related Pol polyprotein from type-1 retrotransposable element R1 4 [Elysia marginata]|uniref:Retrovirus-related Pol polyprotein from type-1 retrotransposable element R1 4 n=1 Tax=Elysia marginata TaxID=1093978 RepID=A0AAV4EYH4_9GAST|nr:LOW QUALITY PROTEIN: retrovirus-related Pol polyprotein from type-1 retrotransposable element R1 4 [Elysia marginata]